MKNFVVDVLLAIIGMAFAIAIADVIAAELFGFYGIQTYAIRFITSVIASSAWFLGRILETVFGYGFMQRVDMAELIGAGLVIGVIGVLFGWWGRK